jgi:single-strand DNA-binding protein
MANFNKVLLMGNLTRDPELRYTPGGTAVASFGLAVNRKWTGQNGEEREETVFVDVSAFGRQAEVISEYMSKGRGIFLEGRLKLDQWQDKETQAKRSKLVVIAESFQFLGGPGGERGGGAAGEGGGKTRAAQPKSAPAGEQEAAPDDDIPF